MVITASTSATTHDAVMQPPITDFGLNPTTGVGAGAAAEGVKEGTVAGSIEIGVDAAADDSSGTSAAADLLSACRMGAAVAVVAVVVGAGVTSSTVCALMTSAAV